MKRSYITLLSTEEYLNGVLVLNESLKKVKSQYPLTVAITEQISDRIKKILEERNINFIKISKVDVPEDIKTKNMKGIFSHWNNTFDKLKIFELTEFDKLVFLDSDMFVRKNIDELFDKEHFSAVVDRREPDVIEEWKKLTSGTLVIEPKQGIINDFLNIMNGIKDKRESIGDQDVLQEYDKDWDNNEKLHLDVKYNTFFIYLDYYINKNDYKLEDISVVHFILKIKPWTLNYKNIDEYLEFLDNRLKFNYDKTGKEVFNICRAVGSDNKRKVLMEYLDILNLVRIDL